MSGEDERDDATEDEFGERDADVSEEERRRRRLGRKLTDSLLTSLLEGGAAIKRGQDRVSGVAQGTKDEVLRLVGSEVRGFLDKIDVVDMMQKVVSGLVIDVDAQIRIRRDDESGKLATEVTRQEVSLGGEERSRSPRAAAAEGEPDEGEED